MKKGNNIEELFKDAFDQFEVDPGDQLWGKIQGEIPSAGTSSAAGQAASTASKVGSGWLTTAVVGGAIAVTSIAGYYYFEKKAEARKTSEEVQPLVEEETAPSNQSSTLPLEVAKEEKEDLDSDQLKSETLPKEEKAELSKDQTERPEKETKIAQKELHNEKEQISSEENLNNESEVGENDLSTSSDPDSELSSEDAEVASSTAAGTAADKPVTSTSKGPSNKSFGKDKDHDNNLDPDDPSVDDKVEEEVDAKQIAIEEYKIQNVITPNGDGITDIFKIEPSDLESLGVTAIKVQIFNAATNGLVYEYNDIYGSWDGRNMSGNKVSPGAYFCIVIMNQDGKEYMKKQVINVLE